MGAGPWKKSLAKFTLCHYIAPTFSCNSCMDLISFDALRTLGFPGVTYIKPELMYSCLDRIRQADGILFPEYWQINTLFFALRKNIFPSLSSYLIGHDKVEMTRCFQALTPHNVPCTEIAANTPVNADRIWELMAPPFVAKIPRASMGRGVFFIEDSLQWQEYLAISPVIYAQEYLPIDRDLRIIWIGNRVVGGYWRLQSNKGFYNNISQGGQIADGILPPSALALVEYLATSLDIDHGGFDIAFVDGHPYVFEFNRIFGNQGLTGKAALIEREICNYVYDRWGNKPPLEPAPAISPGKTQPPLSIP